MSEWFYIWFAYGLTWITLAAFAGVLISGRRKAAATLQHIEEAR